MPLELVRARYPHSFQRKTGSYKSSRCFLPISAVDSSQIKLLLYSTVLPHPMTVLWELKKREILVSSVSYKTTTKAEKLIYRGRSLPQGGVLTKSSLRKTVGH